MADHFCEDHQTKFFKTAKMSGYAHPIKVEDQTVGWCNEDAKEVAKLPAQKAASPPLQPGEEHIVTDAQRLGARVTGVDNFKNRAVAISYAKDLLCAGVIDKEKLIGYADKFLNYIENK